MLGGLHMMRFIFIYSIITLVVGAGIIETNIIPYKNTFIFEQFFKWQFVHSRKYELKQDTCYIIDKNEQLCMHNF